MRALIAAFLSLIPAGGAYAQSPVARPNPMAPHTVFIILIVGAFLAWAASFSFHTMKERSEKRGREALLARRESILDQLAEAENGKASGAVSEERFHRRTRELRGELARVLEKLQSASKRRRTHA